MRFDVSHLVKAPIWARDIVHLDVEAVTLSDDLVMHSMRGDISFTRTTDGLLAEGQLDVALDAECVRCLSLLPLPLQVQLDDLTFALPQSSGADIEYRVAENGQVDTAKALREQVLLSLPLISVCRPDCRGLCSECGQDLNTGTCDCEPQTIDPRFAALRDLL